jgi:phenylpyruvate tautomerase PptA (4-oxalocrotonate tautomerase family)
MIEVINVPPNDKFQIITEHVPEEFNIADSYLGNDYTQGIILIQVTMNAGRTVEMKKAFFKRIADDLHTQLNVRREDVVINLVEVAKENWSFGGGIAQYAQ